MSEVKVSDVTLSESKGAPAAKSYARRDHLRENEKRIQAKWESERVFETQRRYNADGTPAPKFMVTFPYPYMNGRLHLGHAFSLTKAEFAVRYQRLQNKNALFPFGFHCTGMPIQAAANKLKEEIAKYGCPPVIPTQEAPEEETPVENSAESVINAKSKGKKTKLAVKGMTGVVTQYSIMSKMVPEEEIPQFVDPLKWLDYFPPYGITDLKAFGTAVDWRRSFITTSVNPFYDAFIRWQFNRLKDTGRIKYGKRANVYSIGDGQVCADHDRASGEGVCPQEYTLIKLAVLEVAPSSPLARLPAGRPVYLAAATLRAETMYGQTNCFVLPEGDYGAYELTNGDILVMSHRAARGMSCQGYMNTWGEPVSLVDIKGSDLIGLPLKAPNAAYDRVYVLPLLTISMNKGTGVVTSVPSDAPDDYAALKELKDKPLFRAKFGLTDDMVMPFEVVRIINIEGYGDKSAVVMCEKLDIKSCKDTEKLKIAKNEVYLKGFYEGVMIVGQCAGMKVCDAKPIIKQAMLDAGDALVYYEPENPVTSRSGDDCVVALTDQWYLAYGEPDWMQAISDHIHSPNFNGYNDKIMEQFDFVVGWLKEWACCRQFGLGTKLPWDEQFVIESLSDSTIYMAYYTIAHYFHGYNNLSGIAPSPSNIRPEDVNDAVFDYIFLRKEYPAGCAIAESLLSEMRDEFEYWYPMDLRVSAKDLIPNHLTMSLYNHAAIWQDRPELWPRGIYCNGHVMVDAEKMSKSKGNFLMMLECVEEFTADAARLALADAGDTMEDANFDRAVANNLILSLFVEEEFVRSVVEDNKNGKLRQGEMTFMDRCLDNEISHIIECTAQKYEQMCFRDAMHKCWYEMIIIRDFYRDWAAKCEINFHADVIMRFIDAFVVMMSPICPHWSENLWEVMGKPGLVVNALWPATSPCDFLLRKQYLFLRETVKNGRQTALKVKEASRKNAHIYLAQSFEPKKVEMLQFLQQAMQPNGKFPATVLADMKTFLADRPDLKKDTKMLMQFGAFMKNEAELIGVDALATELTFDQKAILADNLVYVAKSLEIADLQLYYNTEEGPKVDKKKMDGAIPGKPTFCFFP